MDIKRTDMQARKRRRRAAGAAIALALVAGIGFAAYNLDSPALRVEASQVWIDTVERGEMLRQIRGSGVLVPREVRWISAQSPGRVERVLVKPGARVTADQVLIELGNPDLHQALEEAEWALSAGRAELASTRAELANEVLDRRANLASVEAQYESARLQSVAEADLANDGIIPKIQAQQSALDVEQLEVRLQIEHERLAGFRQVVEARISAEESRVRQLENTLKRRREQVENLQLRAGTDGVLQEVVVEEGQQLVVGTSVGRVARPGELLAELRVPEINARYIQLDQTVAVDTRNGIAEGRVVRIDPAVQNGTVQVDVDLVGELPPGVRPDLTVDGTIEIERLVDVLHLDRPAYAQPDSITQLFLVEGDGTARRVQVRLGRASVNQVEVLEGLAPGDRVIVSDISAWDRHERLRITP